MYNLMSLVHSYILILITLVEWINEWAIITTFDIYEMVNSQQTMENSSRDFFSNSHVWMWELDYKESWVPKNWCFELWCLRRLLRAPWTARRSNQSILKEISLSVHWNDWCWSWNSNTLATWCEELTHLKRLWCWERLRAGGEGDDRGWDGWMASLTQ